VKNYILSLKCGIDFAYSIDLSKLGIVNQSYRLCGYFLVYAFKNKKLPKVMPRCLFWVVLSQPRSRRALRHNGSFFLKKKKKKN
jgi:hypothetical protein